MDLIRPLVDWARRCYLRPKGSQFATNRQVNKKDFMEVHGAASIEESIWSASLGLKGKIDATLEVPNAYYSCTFKLSDRKMRLPSPTAVLKSSSFVPPVRSRPATATCCP